MGGREGLFMSSQSKIRMQATSPFIWTANKALKSIVGADGTVHYGSTQMHSGVQIYDCSIPELLFTCRKCKQTATLLYIDLYWICCKNKSLSSLSLSLTRKSSNLSCINISLSFPILKVDGYDKICLAEVWFYLFPFVLSAKWEIKQQTYKWSSTYPVT